MSVYERSTRVKAPLSEVWEFHSRVQGLKALTPSWMNLRIESVHGPDGEPDPGILEAGSEITMSSRPLGIGPRQEWTSRIVEREADDASARFRDEMIEGGFPEWKHTHSFFADGDDATVVHDRIEYRLPGGGLGEAVGPIAHVGFEPMFRHRHRRTREILE